MKILVTGGAGYIGSVVVKQLIKKGYNVVVVDNFSKGVIEIVDSRAKIYRGDLIDYNFLTEVFEKNNFDYIMHFAAYKYVGESMENPIKYSDNIIGAINLFNLAIKYKIKKVILSSSAAVYGNVNDVVDEDDNKSPINYYGYTKLVVEDIARWYRLTYGIDFISFRYFNVAGDEVGYIDPSAQNIFPILMEVVIGKREFFSINGDDFNTPDGTCVRDYVDVRDLARAHIIGLDSEYVGALNLGSEKGYSVKEVVDSFKKISGVDFKVVIGNRREGDPDRLVASIEKVKRELNWEPEFSIDEMISSTIDAHKKI